MAEYIQDWYHASIGGEVNRVEQTTIQFVKE